MKITIGERGILSNKNDTNGVNITMPLNVNEVNFGASPSYTNPINFNTPVTFSSTSIFSGSVTFNTPVTYSVAPVYNAPTVFSDSVTFNSSSVFSGSVTFNSNNPTVFNTPVSFSTTPEFSINSPRWIDLYPMPPVAGLNTSALTIQAVRDTPFIASFFSRSQNDSVSLTYQMPHNWITGSIVNVHLHCIPHGTAGGVVVIDGQYAWTYLGYSGTLPQNSGWTTYRVTRSIAVGDLFTEIAISVPDITPPSWAKASACLHVFWRRPASTDAGDTFESNNPTGSGAANLQLVSFDAHVQVAGFGTTNTFGPD
jgi:hypothetical protein